MWKQSFLLHLLYWLILYACVCLSISVKNKQTRLLCCLWWLDPVSIHFWNYWNGIRSYPRPSSPFHAHSLYLVVCQPLSLLLFPLARGGGNRWEASCGLRTSLTIRTFHSPTSFTVQSCFSSPGSGRSDSGAIGWVIGPSDNWPPDMTASVCLMRRPGLNALIWRGCRSVMECIFHMQRVLGSISGISRNGTCLKSWCDCTYPCQSV